MTIIIGMVVCAGAMDLSARQDKEGELYDYQLSVRHLTTHPQSGSLLPTYRATILTQDHTS